MLEIQTIQSKKEKREFINFIYLLYKGNICFKDMQVHIVRAFLYNEDSFTKECFIRPMVVKLNNKTLAQCMFIYNKKLPVLQVSFFEAFPHQHQAVTMLLLEAEKECRNHGLSRIIIGLNGHVSYGVGFLMNNFDTPVSFDCLYSPPYYHSYFDKQGIKKQTLSTYYFLMKKIQFNEKLMKKVYNNVSFRIMDMKRFKQEILLFGRLCNESLKETYLYFSRSPVAMYELINKMRFFLKPENLIFAVKDNKEIGFMFWHPDYNEIFPGGKKNSLATLGINYMYQKKQIKGIKLNAIGILPGYQRTGVLIGLVHQTHFHAGKQFSFGETNFVWDNNPDSSLINRAMTEKVLKRYCVYEIDVQDP